MTITLGPITNSDLPIIFEQISAPESSTMAAPARDKEAFDAHWARIMADENIILRTTEVDGRWLDIWSVYCLRKTQVGYW